MINKLKGFFREEKGQGLVEYGLILALISVLSIGAVSGVGGSVKETFQTINDEIELSSIPTPPTIDERYMWIPITDSTEGQNFSYTSTNKDHNGRGYYKYIGDEPVVEIPHTIHGHKMTNYYRMFDGSNVEKVINNNPTVRYMDYMFHGSQSPSLDLSEVDTRGVMSMAAMFYRSKAQALDLSTFDTSRVVNVQSMFNNSQAKTIDLSSFDTGQVTHFAFMFHNSKVESIDVSSFNTDSALFMDHMFYGAPITELDLSSFNTSKVKLMQNMFAHSTLTSLDLSSFDTQKAEHMFGMFYKSKITEGFARNAVEAERFNTSKDKPEGLTFIVK